MLQPQPPQQVCAARDTSPTPRAAALQGPTPAPGHCHGFMDQQLLQAEPPCPTEHPGWVKPPCPTTASPWGSSTSRWLHLPFTPQGPQGSSFSAGNVLTTSGEPQRAPEYHQVMLTWVPTRCPDLGTSSGPNTSPGTDMCQKPQRSQPAQDAPWNFPCVCHIMYLEQIPIPAETPSCWYAFITQTSHPCR